MKIKKLICPDCKVPIDTAAWVAKNLKCPCGKLYVERKNKPSTVKGETISKVI